MAKATRRKNFPWPLQILPVLRRSGRYPFSKINSGRLYRHPTVALHQHFYHGILHYEGGPSIAIQPGDVTCSPPDKVTRYDLQTDGYHWCVHFDPAASEKSKAVQLPLYLRLGAAGSYVTEKLRSLGDLHTRVPKNDGQVLKTALSYSLQDLILWLALRQKHSPAKIGSRLEKGIAKARLLLDENFRNPPGPAGMAKAVGLNRNYLATHFKRQTGMTMDVYLLRRRLDVAAQLLGTTQLTVKEIAFEAGIPDPQYFNKQFRRLLGISPTAYRQTHNPLP